jgi:hypothetical protein
MPFLRTRGKTPNPFTKKLPFLLHHSLKPGVAAGAATPGYPMKALRAIECVRFEIGIRRMDLSYHKSFGLARISHSGWAGGRASTLLDAR